MKPPVVFGAGWKLVKAKIKLILEVPRRRDITDEVQLTVKPTIEAEKRSPNI